MTPYYSVRIFSAFSFRHLFSTALLMLSLLGSGAAVSVENSDMLPPVNINQASADVLASSLDGVGIKKAEAIVVYRQSHGDFSSAEDLLQVKGIGEKILEKNRSLIQI